MEHNIAGFIFFLTGLSLTYVWMTGLLKRGLDDDAPPGTRQKLITSVLTLPALGIAISLSYPHYEIGLAGAGIILGFVMTLNGIVHGLATLTTEPFAVGILSLVARRSGIGGDTSENVQEVLSRFGYHLTPDHLGYLTGGILAGVLLGIVPRLFLKHRAIQKAKVPVLNGRQRRLQEQKELKDKMVRKTYSRKARKQGALIDRMRALEKDA